MKVAVLCEFSGIVRDAFLAKGHDAISCDLLDSEKPGPHIKGDCRDYDWSTYDLVIAHPPCTYLAISGARWWKNCKSRQAEAISFVRWILALPVNKIALENPISLISTVIRKPDQIIQPWQFGVGEVKATCFWLKNLPLLKPTKKAWGRHTRSYLTSQSKDRWKKRSRTYQNIAEAMVIQWGQD